MLIFIKVQLAIYLITGHSNTSHVNLYHAYKSIMYIKWLIQIHLMLIFILPNPNMIQIGMVHSNTSHVNLYPGLCGLSADRKQIQIHLMLIFIFYTHF